MRNKLLTIITAMMLVMIPQTSKAWVEWEDFDHDYPLWGAQWGYGYNSNGLQYYYNGGNPYITWQTIVYDSDGNDEGFYNDGDHNDGLGVYIRVGDGPEYYVGHLGCSDGGYSRRLNRSGTWFDNSLGESPDVIPWEYGGSWHFEYGEGNYDGGKVTWIKPRWYIPLAYRNANITLHLKGVWWKWTRSHGSHDVERTVTTPCGYTFYVRSIGWNGDYSVAPDGTVSVPVGFSSGGCNTDGSTHICTLINGAYSGGIGSRATSSDYSPMSYSFNLSEIGMNMSSEFTIEPYHEFTHYNDKDAGNGVKYYNTLGGSRTFKPLPKATINKCVFSQADRKVVLNWNVSNTNYGDGKWVIYRNGVKIAAVPQSQTEYEDIHPQDGDGFPYESDVTYQVCYVLSYWDEGAVVPELRSDAMSVNTQRHVYVNNLSATSPDSTLIFTWETYSYPKDWGHHFNVYINDERVGEITPFADDQTQFRFEHRYADTVRISGQDSAVFWVAERLNACAAHNYSIRGAIGDFELDQGNVQNVSISVGTTFYSLSASKAAYAGQVRLSWHVNLRGSTLAKTYIVERRIAERNDAWQELTRFKSDDEYLTYTDDTPLPGIYYEYRVTVVDICEDGTRLHNVTSDIGFAQTTGTVTGRVTYGSSGMAVQGVEVVAHKTNEAADGYQYHALWFRQKKGELEWQFPKQDYAAGVFNGPFTIQLWVNPINKEEGTIVKLQSLSLGMNANGTLQLKTKDKTYDFKGVTLKAKKYNHIALTCDSNRYVAYVLDKDTNGLPLVHSYSLTLPAIDWSGDTHLSLGGMRGYMDEFRLWKKVLTEKEILANYDRLLVGNETNLETYWTFDEGLESRSFDYSRTGSTYHEHHCAHGADVSTTNFVPEDLALKATTDENGNYIIMGIPFSGDGTTYSIVPTLGVHEFNPTQQLRFISANSLVHNGTDFEDISSFRVEGIVLYEGTDYPVEGCNFYVDGNICSLNGELITSNAYGQFTISVPIGEHYIQVKKQGHTFVNNGRFPSDENGKGTSENFDKPRTGLTFTDNTLVNFTGRVVGGDVQGSQPIGFGLSTNNIGAATLTLQPQNSDRYRLNVLRVEDETTVSYTTNPDTVLLGNARPDTIRSFAWRGPGAENASKLFIRTDSATGEFSALVPPLVYSVTSIHVGSSGLDVIDSPIAIDLTNPETSAKDSVQGKDSAMLYYQYHTKLAKTYYSTPSFTVLQSGHPDGSFGVDSVEIADAMGKMVLRDIHHTSGDSVEYTYGAPLFKMLDPYVFDIEGYEEYINMDTRDTVVDRVPLANIPVTIENALSDEQEVFDLSASDSIHVPGNVQNVIGNQFTLDSLGQAHYRWWGGLPNITAPYTRTINIYYRAGDRDYGWGGNPLKGIVLGDFPTGNNFVTSGPDHVDMVLRDPPGSQSSITWETGTVTQKLTTKKSDFNNGTSIHSVQHIGVDMEFGFGLGVIAINKNKVVADLSEDVDVSYDSWTANSITRRVTRTKAVSTSDNPSFDGAEGDVFVGCATNIIFGKCRQVNLFRDLADTTKAVIGLHDSITTGLSFGTQFAYSQHYIEHDMLPNLKMLRDSYLTYDANPESFVNTTDQPKYVTALLPSDPNFGTLGTYRMVPPKDSVDFRGDTVSYFTSQIANWIEQLKHNEEEKVKAYNNRASLEKQSRVKNYSFDAGTTLTLTYQADTVTTDKSDTKFTEKGTFGVASGGSVNGLGIEIETDFVAGGYQETETANDTTRKVLLKYTLKDTDASDAISVDVFEDYSKYGSPIFRTRGGQTSNPYEGEVKTKYYEPGTTIMEATMQIEVPKIDVVQPLITDVTSGTAANFELHLMNQSDINADCTFRLFVVDETNPHGAQLTIDGTPLTGEGRSIRVPFGETLVKSLQLSQSDIGVLDFSNIALVLCSKNQSSIADTAYVSAQFVPSASSVVLELSTTTMNTQTGTDLGLTIRDFDRNYRNQKAFRLQYKPQGGDWTLFHEYVLREEDMTNLSELLPSEGGSVLYTLPMFDYSDGLYRFRVASVSTFGTEEIFLYSNEIELVKNLSRPRPLGSAEPADGILDIGDELSITFNEEIVNGELTDLKNFLITGVLNGAEVEHHTALRLIDQLPTTASTDANINLSNTDFSFDAWLYLTEAGTFLSHGTGKNVLHVATNEQGQLVITIGENSSVSESALPRDKWLFLTIAYRHTASQGALSAAVAYDDVTEQLFDAKPIPIYDNRGPVSVGGGAGGAIHELLLWDQARDLATALQQRSVTKNPATRHLIGYWKMNEGEGTTIRDYSRNRHMAMRSESWYMNAINKAVALDGSTYIAVCTANVPPMPTDDYAAELWVRCAPQTDDAQLLQVGKAGIVLTADGTVALENDSVRLGATERVVTDNTWHHILFNVRRLGTAAIFVDGVRALTVSASLIGDLASDSLFVGTRRTLHGLATAATYDRPFIGAVDELRLWKATIASDVLATKRKIRLRGDEPGLSLYYPFETKGLDEYNQVIVSGTLAELTGNGTEAVIANSQEPIADSLYSDDAPALREKPTQTNVPFSFTASSTKIVIDIEAEPEAIEGCLLNFTVRDVRSTVGNYSLPANWTAFVHRNELAWEDNDLTAVQPQSSSVSVTTAVTNRSGTEQQWSLGELPAWLTASVTGGTLSPMERAEITFSVSEGTPIGKYEQTIYATGNNGIETPLTLHLTVIGDVPEWHVNPTDYAFSMDIIGRLNFFGISGDDEDDIIAAFIDDECRGVAQPHYKQRYDGYYLTLTVYGDASDNDKDLTFRAYDASKGITYSLVSATPEVTYQTLSLVGKYDDPVIFNVEDKIEQHILLREGWNWISLNVQADDMSPRAILAHIADDVLLIKGQTNADGFLQRDSNGWSGSMDTLRTTKMYAVKMAAERHLRLAGKSVSPQANPISVAEGWNWIGYYLQQRLTVSDALADLEAANGDILRSQRNICYYDDYEWVGSLLYMEPGAGYILYSTTDDKQFAYPGASVNGQSSVYRQTTNDRLCSSTNNPQLPINERAYPYNMVLVAKAMLTTGEPLASTDIVVFSGDECRAVGTTDHQGILSLLIQGEEPTTLTVKATVDNATLEARKGLLYETDAILGSRYQPIVLYFNYAEGIEEITNDQSQMTNPRKFLRDGILFILRGDKTYTVTGQEAR